MLITLHYIYCIILNNIIFRIQEGIDSLAGYADVFHKNVQASGVIPQVRTQYQFYFFILIYPILFSILYFISFLLSVLKLCFLIHLFHFLISLFSWFLFHWNKETKIFSWRLSPFKFTVFRWLFILLILLKNLNCYNNNK